MIGSRQSRNFIVRLVCCAAVAITATAQTFNTVASFTGSNGENPNRILLLQGTAGDIYGTTTFGGAPNLGTIFSLTRQGSLQTIHAFDGADGALPVGGLIQAADGNFYGSTAYGGASGACYMGCGTIFTVTHSGALTTLHSFSSTDGSEPYGTLVQAMDGAFYGTTYSGGTFGVGTIFEITPGGVFTTLHTFDSTDGAFPFGALIQTNDGDFYGTTAYGGTGSCNDGSTGCGTIFRMTAAGVLTTIYNFEGSDGAVPTAGLVQALDGDFYGTTHYGGASNEGTIFRITRGAILATLHSFDGTDGNYPWAGLTQATDGNFYGTTYLGGTGPACSEGCGTVFSIAPDGTFVTLHNFDSSDGSGPFGGILQATNGVLYGTTFSGGNNICFNGCGTIFSISEGLGPFVKLERNSGKAGQTGGILGQGFTGTTSVSLNGTPASFRVVSDTFIRATVPDGATTGYVTVTTPSGTLTSNVPFYVLP